MYSLRCRELTILRGERQLQLYKTKISKPKILGSLQKKNKSFNLKVHVGVDGLQRKLPTGSVTDLQIDKLTFERLRS